MHYSKQDDYDKFKCIAGECPSSCCKGWEIIIDDESIEKYKAVESSFKERIQSSINMDEECFIQHDGRCAMLNDRDLCDLQLNLGEEMLCYTCGMYPRHVEEFDEVRELSLSLSCPEAARILITRDTFLEFVEYDTDEEEDDPDGYDDFDYMLYSNLLEVREYFYEVLCSNNSLAEKMSTISHIAYSIHNSLNLGEYIDIPKIINAVSNSKLDIEEELDFYIAKKDFSILFELEHLDKNWENTINKTWAYYFENNNESKKHFEKFKSFLCAQTETEIENIKQFSIAGTNILLQLIFTYLCGAVYDDCVYAKVALAVNFVKWTFMIGFAESSGMLDVPMLIKTTYRLAKELEHSDENLIAIDDWFSK